MEAIDIKTIVSLGAGTLMLAGFILQGYLRHRLRKGEQMTRETNADTCLDATDVPATISAAGADGEGLGTASRGVFPARAGRHDRPDQSSCEEGDSNMSDRPRWRGNIYDDITAHWRGLVLRAEAMEQVADFGYDWWWTVYLEPCKTVIVDCYGLSDLDNYPRPPELGLLPTAIEAMEVAENMAREYLEGPP